MKKNVLCLTIAALAANLLAQEMENYITLSEVRLSQIKRTQDVVVTYKVANGGEPVYVLLDILTNGVSIGFDKIKTLQGDASNITRQPVSTETAEKTITWKARADWRGNLATNAEARVRVFYTNSMAYFPGVYMVVDVSKGPSAAEYPVHYTFTPPNLSNDFCRTDQIWLKRIEPGTFTMGLDTAANTNAVTWLTATRHTVTLTNAFFAGIFPITRGQYTNVVAKTVAGWAINPIANISYNTLWGTNDTDTIFDWPTATAVHSNSFMGLIRQKTGLANFTLPTEAQWEYACRAGTTGAWNNGTDITNATSDANLNLLGWYNYHGNATIHSVGTLAPNAWGLYDMHGNVREWCLDYGVGITSNEEKTEPIGPATGNLRIVRGGSVDWNAGMCTSGTRTGFPASTVHWTFGFRLFMPVQ